MTARQVLRSGLRCVLQGAAGVMLGAARLCTDAAALATRWSWRFL